MGKNVRTFYRVAGSSNPRFSVIGCLLTTVPVATFGLGVWQIFRWRKKLERIAELDSKSLAPPIPFSSITDDLTAAEYQKVKLLGKFHPETAVLLGPRTLIRSDAYQQRKAAKEPMINNEIGYNLVVPFSVSGENRKILINRGWIPSKQHTFHPVTTNEVEVVAIPRKHETKPLFMSDRNKSSKLFTYRDVDGMAEALSTDAVYLDLVSVENYKLESFPIPGQTRVTLRNEHVNYIITWFSLSMFTAFMWYHMYIRKKRLR